MKKKVLLKFDHQDKSGFLAFFQNRIVRNRSNPTKIRNLKIGDIIYTDSIASNYRSYLGLRLVLINNWWYRYLKTIAIKEINVFATLKVGDYLIEGYQSYDDDYNNCCCANLIQDGNEIKIIENYIRVPYEYSDPMFLKYVFDHFKFDFDFKSRSINDFDL